MVVPTELSMAVTQVPMFWPRMMGMALPKLTAPVALSACRIPTLALLDWIMPVRIAPASRPRIGFSKVVKSLVKAGTSLSGSTAPLMVSMPVIRMAKPSRMEPMSFLRSLLQNIYRIMPISASTGEKLAGLSIWIHQLSPSRPDRLRIQAVTVVPTLAPMITLMAWPSCITPLFTKPTTITVVAEELWITAVTRSPSRKPRSGLEESFSRIICRRPPACFSSAWPMTYIPYRNSARPPTKVNTLNIFMFSSSTPW